MARRTRRGLAARLMSRRLWRSGRMRAVVLRPAGGSSGRTSTSPCCTTTGRPGPVLDRIPRMTPSGTGLPGTIGAPATRALTAAGYTELRQLANVPAAELRKLHGVGPKALRLLQAALAEQGMSLS